MKIYNLKNKRSYSKLTNITNTEYDYIDAIIDGKINLFQLLKEESFLLKFVNLSHIKFLISTEEFVELFKTNELKFSNLIAKFHKLSTIMFYDGIYIRDITSIIKKNLIYQYENYMLVVIVKDEDIQILENISHLNIICYFQTQILTNLPNNITHLHLTFANHNIFYLLDNLPYGLEILSITLILNVELEEVIFNKKIQEIKSRIKLPFGCKINIIPIVHNKLMN